MSFVAAIDCISFSAAVFALLILGLLGLNSFQYFSNILEWGGISQALDTFEDYVEILAPMVWFMLIYSFLKELAADELGKSKDSLKESEARFRLIFEKAAVGIVIVSTEDRKYIRVNPAFQAMSGFTAEELLSMRPEDLTHEKDWSVEKELLSDLCAGKRSQYHLEKRYKRKEGGHFWGSATVALVTAAADNPGYTMTFVQDITERKKAKKALKESEEKLARFKKMESLGLLAGGVAHDLNNVLAGVVSYPDLILTELPRDSKIRKPIEAIRKSGVRAAAIVEDLLTVARGVAITKGPLNLNHVVNDYLNSPEFELLTKHHPSVSIKTSLDAKLLNTVGSPDHIRKAVMNLVANASEAVGKSGTVVLSTVNRTLDRPLRGFSDIGPGAYVVLTVSDDGPGISSHDLSRIFEPFYTKKIMGRSGTGLGLAVVWNVVQDHSGCINVTTGGSGSTFELYFPVTTDEISDRKLSESVRDHKGNGETILVVDDVESQREISCSMLETLGYQTKSVSSGEEAIEYLADHSVDLVLLDMIMDPGINGRQTYERIAEIHPRQKAIIVSGYAETDDVRRAQSSGAGQFLGKPLTLAKLAVAVKKELAK